MVIKQQMVKGFHVLAIDPDWDWKFIDDSYVKTHQHSARAVNEQLQAIGKSRASKYHKDPFGDR